MIQEKKLVLFGAGKIGRSFIGQLFSRGGYEVVFVDAYEPVIQELNRKRKYRMIIKSDRDETVWIHNVRGVFAGNTSVVADEVSTAGIIAVSVGQAGLQGVISSIASGLLKRLELDPSIPVDIIIAENLRNADDFFASALQKLLPPSYPLNRLVGLVETSIGKMVPIMMRKDIEEDMLQIFAEPYNTLILDKRAFRNPIPQIEGLAPKENMKAWVDRKLFIHNLGHAAAAYLGYLANPSYVFLYEPLADRSLFNEVRNTMLQAADILMTLYPGEFTREGLTDHIDDLLGRFQNRALGDTIFRVGCDLFRKLSADDRLAGAIHQAYKLKLPYNKILNALVHGIHFRAVDEQGQMFPDDCKFALLCKNEGMEKVLTTACGFTQAMQSVIDEAVSMNQRLSLISR
jgi:mannitol-1-phosphate 5-dehydrogenase